MSLSLICKPGQEYKQLHRWNRFGEKSPSEGSQTITCRSSLHVSTHQDKQLSSIHHYLSFQMKTLWQNPGEAERAFPSGGRFHAWSRETFQYFRKGEGDGWGFGGIIIPQDPNLRWRPDNEWQDQTHPVTTSPSPISLVCRSFLKVKSRSKQYFYQL